MSLSSHRFYHDGGVTLNTLNLFPASHIYFTQPGLCRDTNVTWSKYSIIRHSHHGMTKLIERDVDLQENKIFSKYKQWNATCLGTGIFIGAWAYWKLTNLPRDCRALNWPHGLVRWNIQTSWIHQFNCQ